MLRTAANFGGRAYSRSFATVIDSSAEGESLTKESESRDTDINVIVEKFIRTGVAPVVSMPPLVGDFRELVYDFQTALNFVRQSEESFMSLPAKIRATFDNDPQRFVNFCSDPANADKLKEWGLATPDAKVEPERIQKVEIVNKDVDKSK